MSKVLQYRTGVDALLSFRVEKGMKEWLNEEAERLGMSRSEFLRKAVEHYLQYGDSWCKRCDTGEGPSEENGGY